MRQAVFVGLLFFSLRLLGGAEVIVVDPVGGGRFTEIQPALDAAQGGDTVLVKPGEYVIAEPIVFPQRAITLRSEAGPEQTILRGAEAQPRLSEVVLFGPATGAAVMDGFTITNARHGVFIAVEFDPGGLGPVVKRCRIQANLSGGVECELSAPSFFDCTISDNGENGLYFDSSHPVVLVRCTISGNRSCGISGGYGTVHLTDCKVTTNACGILLDEAGRADLLRCDVSGNQRGMVVAWECGASLVNSRVTGNAEAGILCMLGNGLYLTNSTVAENGATGIDLGQEFRSTLENCIVWGNPMSALGVVWYEAGQSWPHDIRVTHSILEGPDVFPGEGNSNSDPLFAGPGDFRLQAGSPAIDGGTPDGAPATDIEGYARPCGAGVDMGAHEAGGCLPEAQAALGDPPDPVVQGSAAVAFAGALTLPGGDEEWTLDGAEFRNLGSGDAASLVESARLYADDGDGKFTDQDAPLGSAAVFDPAAQTVVFSGLDRTGAPGSQMTLFLVCRLPQEAPVARALGGSRIESAAEPLLALCGLALIVSALWSRRRLLRLLPGLFLLACAGFVPSSGCGDGSGSHHRVEPASRDLQVELTTLDVHGSPGLKVQVNGLPCQAWTFDA